jgi:hypothetical protein
MSGQEETLPVAFSLLKSEFNDFLCAAIGEEENHSSLTLLSALSRQGIDPWLQADRLNRLPRDTAALRLAQIIEDLPDGRWTQADASAIAARLVALLPRRATLKATPGSVVSGIRPQVPRIAKLLIYAALLALSLFLAMRQW